MSVGAGSIKRAASAGAVKQETVKVTNVVPEVKKAEPKKPATKTTTAKTTTVKKTAAKKAEEAPKGAIHIGEVLPIYLL